MKAYRIYRINANSKKIDDSKIVLASSKKDALKQGYIGDCYNEVDRLKTFKQ